MRHLFIFIILVFTLSSCGSSKRRQVNTKKTSRTSRTRTPKTRKANTTTHASSATINRVVKNAKSYKGTRYKYGGTTRKGMDCSGLIYTSFRQENLSVPRTSGSMSTSGKWVDLKKVRKGDLLFFATKKNSRKVNHVGLVTYSNLGNVRFVHASSSKGVIESSIAEKYWYYAFVQARRLL